MQVIIKDNFSKLDERSQAEYNKLGIKEKSIHGILTYIKKIYYYYNLVQEQEKSSTTSNNPSNRRNPEER